MKKLILILIKLLSFALYPFFLIKRYIKSSPLNSINSYLYSILLKQNGANIGRNLHIGKSFKLKIKGNTDIIIGNNVIINDDVYINVQNGARLKIGNNVHINKGVRISSFKSIIIKDNTLVASYVNILDHNHKYDLKSPASIKYYDIAPIIIGEGSWLGTKVQVNKGVTIGDYCVVAANSVVTKNLDNSSVYGGIPAKKINVKKNN